MSATIIESQPGCGSANAPGLLTVDEARRRIFEAVQPIGMCERVPLRAALGRILAADIVSPIDVPAHTNSAMDGYALAAHDLPKDAVREFQGVGTAWAGRPFPEPVRSGQVARIMTGAPLRLGTDTVVMQEQVERVGAKVRIGTGHRLGQNVRQAGEDLARGMVVLSAGKRIMPAELGLLQPYELLAKGLAEGLAIISDDAGQFDVPTHGLCWVHAECLIHKLIPLNKDHRADPQAIRAEIWAFYAALKAYREAPSEAVKAQLEARFDALFTRRTRYEPLNQRLKRLHRHKAELLLVLARPDVPLHTNDAENDLRDPVKKRRISAGTRSDPGRRCWDTFASLKKTCRKLGVSFWTYITDRVSGTHALPPLPEIIQARAASQ